MRPGRPSEKRFCDAIRELIAEAGDSIAPSRRHIDFGPIRLYLRVGPRLVGDRMVRCVQIASIDTQRPSTGGWLDRILDLIDEAAPELAIYVENVIADRLRDGLERRGFVVERLGHLTSDLARPAALARGRSA